MSATIPDAVRVNLPESPTLDSLSLETTKAVTVRVPKTILNRVDSFQEAYRERYGRKLSRENAVLRILLLSEYAADEQLLRWEEEIEAAAASEEE